MKQHLTRSTVILQFSLSHTHTADDVPHYIIISLIHNSRRKKAKEDVGDGII